MENVKSRIIENALVLRPKSLDYFFGNLFSANNACIEPIFIVNIFIWLDVLSIFRLMVQKNRFD
jgi:hypothetical protein